MKRERERERYIMGRITSKARNGQVPQASGEG